MSDLTVRRISAELPELAEDAWAAFDDTDAGTPLLSRAVLLAEAETFDNPLWIAASWGDSGRLRGIAVAIEEQRPSGRVLVAAVHYCMRVRQCSGLWFARGEDRAAVGQALMAALLDHARELGLPYVIVGFVPTTDQALRDAAVALGARVIDAPLEYQLELAPHENFASLQARLSYSGRRHWKNYLTDYQSTGAEIVHTRNPSAAELAAAWSMQQEAYRRKGTVLSFKGDFYSAITRRVAPGTQLMTTCRRGELMLGFVVSHLTSNVGYIMGNGHVDGEPFHVLPTVMAHAIRALIEGGIRTLLIGSTSDTYKQRLGFTATTSMNLVLRAAKR